MPAAHTGTTMKAAVLTEINAPLTIVELEQAPPKAGEARVKVKATGVCMRDDMPWAQAALVGCSVATGVGAVVRHAKIVPGSSVLVIGCGGVGLNIVQGARLAGAMRIIAADLLPNKLAYAKAFGATDTI